MDLNPDLYCLAILLTIEKYGEGYGLDYKCIIFDIKDNF